MAVSFRSDEGEAGPAPGAGWRAHIRVLRPCHLPQSPLTAHDYAFFSFCIHDMRHFAVVCSCISLAACVPMSSTYERIEASGASYFKNTCRGTVGPPSTVYYPFHGIYISLNFSYTTFGLHIPEGMRVQLNDNTIVVNGVSASGTVQRIVHVKAYPAGSAGNNDPPEFAVTAFVDSPDSLGPFEGRTAGSRYVYYLFMGVDETHPNRTVSLPNDLIEGSVVLPAMTINGQRFESQTLPFKQAKFSEISPINC
jgi:hypothetical protein